jgi:hypothetical protein
MSRVNRQMSRGAPGIFDVSAYADTQCMRLGLLRVI